MIDDGRMGTVMDGVRADVDADWSVSSDAMRWSPEGTAAEDFAGVDCRTGFTEALRPYARRLAARVAAPFAEVAADMLDELRGLRRPRRWGRPTPARS